MLNNPKSGPQAAFEFQISALPWVTSSTAPAASSGPVRIDFPMVTKFFTITNRQPTGTWLTFGFTRNGMTGSNKYFLNGGDTQTFDLRTTQLYIQGEGTTVDFSLVAGLTQIQSSMMPVLTGSLWEGVG